MNQFGTINDYEKMDKSLTLDQLAKYLQIIGKEAKWRAELGFIEDDPYNRK